MFKGSRHFNYTTFHGDCWNNVSPGVCDAVGHSHLSYNAIITIKTIVSQNLLFHCCMVCYSISTCTLNVKQPIENRSTLQPLSPDVNGEKGNPAPHFQNRNHSTMGLKEKCKKRGYNNKRNFSSFTHTHAGWGNMLFKVMLSPSSTQDSILYTLLRQ